MACGGCKARQQMIAQAFTKAKAGDTSAIAEATRFVGRTLVEDAGRIAADARTRAAARLQATARSLYSRQ